MRDDGVDHDEIERLAKIGSWVRDLEAGTLSWSRELRRIFGIDEDAPASFELLLSRMHPEDRAYMQREFGTLERRLDVDLIHCLRLVDGTEKYLHAKGRVVMGPNGRPARVLGTMQDITERVRADQEHERLLARLREREEILRHAVGVADLGIFVHDQVHETIYWSPEYRQLSGWGPDEDVSLPAAVEAIHPEDRPRVVASIVKAHDPKGDGVWRSEHRIVRRDGDERWIVGRSQTFFEGAGAERRPVRTIGVTFDVTERRRTEEILRQKDQAIATAVNGIAMADATGRITYVNAAFVQMFGLASEAEAIGKVAADFTDPDAARELLETLARTGSYSGELDAVRKDETRFPILLVATVSRDATGAIKGLIGSFVDVGDARKLRAQLAQAQKMEAIGRLAGGVAHDFNNLLTVIKGNIDLALMKPGPEHPGKSELVDAARAVESAGSLTQQLLAFSRKQVIAPRFLDLNAVIRDVAKMLQRLLGEDIEMRTSLHRDLWTVRFDPAQSEQILVNLAVNARDAMPRGGRLFVETTNVHLDAEYASRHTDCQPGDYVMLAVSDTGTGMTEDVRANVFEPFFTTKDPGSGTGLGLAMVYGAVSQNGGRIEVYSEVGAGTTFKVYLPRAEGTPAARPAIPTGPLLGGSEVIALVEDDASVRKVAARVLEGCGYHVHAFETPASALEAFRGGLRVDLVLTDVVMPGMNGKELARAVQEIAPKTRVLFTSGYTANVIVHHSVLADGIEFLPKPYSVDALTRRVRDVLDK